MKRFFATLVLAACLLVCPGIGALVQSTDQHSISSTDTSQQTNQKKTEDSAVPKDETAKYKDGTYSHAKHHQGTCSDHGGLGTWYK
jgi:uncharacterized protein with FMN-binding domain